jgi:hypothetical protein
VAKKATIGVLPVLPAATTMLDPARKGVYRTNFSDAESIETLKPTAQAPKTATKHPTPPQSPRRSAPKAPPPTNTLPPPSKKSQQEIANDELTEKLTSAMQKLGLDANTQTTLMNVVADASEDSATFSRRYAVPCERFYGPNKCVICEETVSFTFLHAKEQMSLRPGGINGGALVLAGNALQRKKQRQDLAMRARVAVAANDQNAHKLISFFQTLLAGDIADDRIFRMMLILRRYLIERFYEAAQQSYVKWRLRDLREHFHPVTGHQYDALRQEIHEHNMCRRVFSNLANMSDDADFSNKEVLTRVATIGKLRKTLQEGRARIAEERAQKDPNLAEALRTVAMAITKNITDINADQVETDVETAAGMIEMGGDSRTTAANKSLEYKDVGTVYSHQLSAL